MVTGTLGKANSLFDPTQTGPGTTTLRQLLIGAVQIVVSTTVCNLGMLGHAEGPKSIKCHNE